MSTSHRVEQVGELIKQELSLMILREVDFPEGLMVTITKVKVTPDMRQARVFISIMPFARRFVALEKLKAASGELQRQLMDKLVMKFTPRISFVFDENEEYAAKIDELLKEGNN